MFGSAAVFVIVLSVLSQCDGMSVDSMVINNTRINGNRWCFYVDASTGRMVSAVTDQYGLFQDCYLSGDSALTRVVVQSVPESNVTQVDKSSMDQIAEECAFAKANGLFEGEDGEEVWQQLGIFSGFFIYPGTKWCGAGNISSGYEDLGSEPDTDTCCRDHDHCEDNIEGFESKHGLENSSPFTKSHCDCDVEFFECLAKTDTRTSHRVGRLYFNFLQMECFRQDHPTTGCKKYRGWFRRRCLEYEYDYKQGVEWQFFDSQHYKGESNDDENEEDNEVDDKYRGDVFEYMIRVANRDEENYPHTEINKVS